MLLGSLGLYILIALNYPHFSFADNKGGYSKMTDNQYGSLWSLCLMAGVRVWIGCIWKPKQGIINTTLVEVDN